MIDRDAADFDDCVLALLLSRRLEVDDVLAVVIESSVWVVVAISSGQA